MPLNRYFSAKRIINLSSDTLEGALKELLGTFSDSTQIDRRAALQQLLAREQSIPTFLGNGIAIPHIRVPLKRTCTFAVGRCPNGVGFNNIPDYREIRLIFLILFNEEDESYLQVLTMLARIFHDPQKIYSLLNAHSLVAFRQTLYLLFSTPKNSPGNENQKLKIHRTFLKEAFRMAVGAGCQSVFIFADTFSDSFSFENYFKGLKTILVTERAANEISEDCGADHILSISNYSSYRLAQMRSAILLALSRSLIRSEEKLCCIGGMKGSNRIDCLMLIDVAEEYKALFKSRRGLIPKDVKPEVFERVIAIAHEIAVEGREGTTVGTMLVLGNHEKLKNHYRSLVLNPFQGYPRQERNILNPFMDETIKEFASLDGAFIIDGDGVLEAAGAMVNASERGVMPLPSGFGTRHAAGAAVSKAYDCVVVVISESTSQVTLFRNGQMLPLSGKVVG